jgi:4-hydroxy-3-polyprenylbenzoate decarboxylase
MKSRIVVAITGASGAPYGIRALEALRAAGGYEVHLVVSAAGRATISEETDLSPRDVEALADVVHSPSNVGAPIASGSFATAGMLVAPCSVKTLSAIAGGYTADLVSRAADVQLKEGRPVLLLFRETPLHLGHLRLMTQAAEAGAIVMPPVPAFYSRPKSVQEIVDHTVGRALSRIGIATPLFSEWTGIAKGRPASS